MRVIDEKIMNALKELRSTTRTNAELARKLGFSRNHISKLFNNKCTHFKSKTWERLKPILFATGTISTDTTPDGLTIELESQWPELDRGQKLRVLTFINELLQDRGNYISLINQRNKMTNLKKMLLKKKIRQHALSCMTGSSDSTISRHLKNGVKTIRVAKRYAKVLGCSPLDLMDI